MEKIEVNGKKYPFLVSSATAKETTKRMALRALELRDLDKASEEEVKQITGKVITEEIDINLLILYRGLKDGRLAQPFWKRFYLIPSKKRLERILGAEETKNIISKSALPKGNASEDDEEEDTEKKH